MPPVTFTKISYDRILGEKVSEYQKAHPGTEMHIVIDIIRPMADQEYLDRVARQCFNAAGSEQDRENVPLGRQNAAGNKGDKKKPSLE